MYSYSMKKNIKTATKIYSKLYVNYIDSHVDILASVTGYVYVYAGDAVVQEAT